MGEGGNVFTITSINNEIATGLIWVGANDEEYYHDSLIEDVFPILRPLSDLTKEIEHNGEKFVPIVEIGKMLGMELKPYDIEDGIIGYGWDIQNFDDVDAFAFGWYDKGKCFGVWYDDVEDNKAPLYTEGGLNEIQKLYAWHFDIHGLIERGDAIDINTLNL